MDFVLYYTVRRTSHGRMLGEKIVAETVPLAFKKAVEIMLENNMTPDDFDSFYVSPVARDYKKKYCMQLHGWDHGGALPRQSY